MRADERNGRKEESQLRGQCLYLSLPIPTVSEGIDAIIASLFDTVHPLLEEPGQQEQDDARADRDPGDGREGRRIGVQAHFEVCDLTSDGLDAGELRDDTSDILRDRDRQE